MKKYTRAYLKEILQISVGDLNYSLIVWGTGNTAVLYQEGFKRLESEGFDVFGYADNDSSRWGSTFSGKRIYSPDEVQKMENVMVLIASPQPKVISAVGKQMDELGLKWMHIDSYIFKTHREEVIKCYDLLDDEESKQLYVHLVECRMNGVNPDINFIDNGNYFSCWEFFDTASDEVFVDCGAYVGDSLEQYIWRKQGTFKKYIAFEPDSGNVQALEYRIDRLKKEWNLDDSQIIIYQYGISDEDTVKHIRRGNKGLGSQIIEADDLEGNECKLVSIDSVLDEKYDALKADIESYEYKMLLGAKESIKKWSPRLAICIYHNAVDFYSIALLIHEINPKYRFCLKQYTNTVIDTVLYAFE